MQIRGDCVPEAAPRLPGWLLLLSDDIILIHEEVQDGWYLTPSYTVLRDFLTATKPHHRPAMQSLLNAHTQLDK